MEMAKEPSHKVVDKEIAYRIGIQGSAANKLTQEELKVVYSITPSLKPVPGQQVMVQQWDAIEVDIDGRTF